MDEEQMIEDFIARAKVNRENFAVDQPIIAERLVWLGVHGALCLALRHPQFNTATAGMVRQFVHQLGDGLVDWGILTPDELDYLQRTEPGLQASK